MRFVKPGWQQRPERPPGGRVRVRGALVPGMLFLATLCGGATRSSAADAPAVPENVPEPQALIAALTNRSLDAARAVPVERLKLKVDLAEVHLEHGWIFPATQVAGRDVELVFVGEGRFRLEPPDDTEAGQLELFTGETRLDRPFDAAVFVVASDAASSALFRRTAASAPPSPDIERAKGLWERWRVSGERRALGVDATLLADALGEALYSGAFVAWLHQKEEPPIIFQLDPAAEEPVNLGKFEPLDADDREQRRIARELRSQQKRGRGLGLAIADLGDWEQWLLAPMHDATGKPQPRRTLFEPVRYVLDATISGSGDLTLAGRARIVVRAQAARHRVVVATLHPDLVVGMVRDSRGAALAFHRSGAELAIVLAAPPAAGDETVVEIEYEGRFLDKAGRSLYALRDSLAWYPHLGAVDRAPYDVTLSWPKRLEVVAAGERVDGGERLDGTKWERRKLETPALGYSFEVGKFDVARANVERPALPPIAVEVYFDAESDDLPKAVRQEIVSAITDSLSYFGEVFSPYTGASLRVVTVPRMMSQGLPGFVTLSSLSMSELSGGWRLLLGIEDRRTTAAHEIAHQWWGNRVGWASYRDQWISESMATYSAMLWARNRLPAAERPLVGPTSGWQDDLLATTEDGRVVESLGPVTLGFRLLSGKEPAAYDAIVYKKGAVVLSMLSRFWTEKDFLAILRGVVEAASGKVISTADLIQSIERLSSTQLDGFARRFIYGTGLPEIQFDYTLGEKQGEKWPVAIRARQQAPYRFRYSVVKKADGKLGVARERRTEMELDGTTFAVPFQVPIDAPWPADAPPPPKARKRGDPPLHPRLDGRLTLQGERTEVVLHLDQRPLGLVLDPRQEVFARFFDLGRSPKRAALRDAFDAAAAGDNATARSRFAEVFTAKVRLAVDFAPADEPGDLEREGRGLDARAHLGLARLAVEAGDLTSAKRELAVSAKGLDHGQRSAIEGQASLLEARIDLASGNAAGAYRRLKRLVVSREAMDGTEGWLLLAIAAHETGQKETLDQALEVARRRSVDLGPLANL
ncbi:MAG: M1 family aminopeptidase [Thermoanaerobaculia bacterium]